VNATKTEPDEILVIDDNSDTLKMMGDILGNAGYLVRLANDGELALRSARIQPPALVLLDIRMPGMDGYEVCQRLKNDEKTRAIPIIFLSALTDEHEKLKAFQVGGVDYINKPVHAAEVLARVHTHLALWHAQLDLEVRNQELETIRATLEEKVKERSAEMEQINHKLRDQIDVHIQTLDALRESEAKYRRFVDTADEGIWSLDKDLKTDFINAKMADLLGYSCEEMVGHTMDDFIFEEDLQEHLQHMKMRHQGISEHYERRFRRKDGCELWIWISSTPINDNKGHFLGSFAMFTDITERKRAVDALRLSSERLQLATRVANIGIWDWDIVKNELVWDESMYQLYGIRKGDFGGAYDAWARTIHPEDKVHTDGEIQAALRGEREYAPEFRIVRPDGSIRHIKADSQTFQNSEGKPLRMIGTNIDITESKRIQRAMQRSQSALEEAQRIGHIGSWDVDMVNDVLIWSDEIFRIWEIDKTQFEATFAAFLETVHPEDRDKVTLAYNQAIIDKSLYQVEHRLLFPDGRVKYIYERGEPYFDEDGHPVRFIGTSLDITERKLAEEMLRHYKDQLEETVQQRTAELRLARDAAEAANKAKSQFLASMSHELRTPLNAILGFSSMMRHDPCLTDRLREHIDIINRSGEHLLTLINDVLEIAKIEAGRIQLEVTAFDLGSMVRDVCDMMQVRAHDKGLQLLLDQNSEFPRYIKGDEARLRQILVNLVGNAVKFTEQGGVTIRLGVKNNARAHLLIEVEDSGSGISEADLKRLFEPFVQLAEGVAQGGTGLGLSITRQFVQLMDGKIVVESHLGEGSLFRVDLPLELASAAEVLKLGGTQGEIIGLASGQPVYRILIVEDQYENQLLLERLMSNLGLETKVAENGELGVQLFSQWHPDLIWMDRRMPVMDGLEAVRCIRHLPGGEHVKIVAVTASVFREQQPEILQAGMDDLVRKPYRFNEIYDCLKRQLGLEYIYHSKNKEEPEPSPLTPEMLAILPSALREEFKETLESLDGELIASVIERISIVDMELAKILSRLAQAFDYPTILNALDEVGKT
jgi:PAS domain S-box-containing protein